MFVTGHLIRKVVELSCCIFYGILSKPKKFWKSLQKMIILALVFSKRLKFSKPRKNKIEKAPRLNNQLKVFLSEILTEFENIWFSILSLPLNHNTARYYSTALYHDCMLWRENQMFLT